MTEGEWGEWRTDWGGIRVGMYIYVEAVFLDGERIGHEGVVSVHRGSGFSMTPPPRIRGGVLERYRIRKPKGLAILNAILREVERQPETV